MSAAIVLEIARLVLAGAVGGAGLVFVLLSVIGLLRFPDLFTRVHAFSVAAGVGAALFAAGLAILAWDWAMFARLALLGGLIAAAGPAIAHFAASAAHAAGLAPLSGAYTAPRPGAPPAGERR